MEREIIFRGKRIDNGEWVKGDLLTRRNAVSGESAIIFFDDEHIIPRSPAVDFETVGQYTGLKDSTGKRIFEGDIVHYKNSIEQAKGIIEWGGCQFYFKWIDITEPNGALYFFQCEKELEVIGNCFDNPELVEVQ